MEKLFYSISEVEKKTDLPQYVIRFWEKEFKQLSPKRIKNRRVYRESDIEVILKIKELLYKKGFTIKGAKKEFLGIKKNDDLENKKNDIENSTSSSFKLLERYSFNKPILKNSVTDFSYLNKIIEKLDYIEDVLTK